MGTYLLIVCCSCSFSLSFIFLFFFSPTKSKGLENSAREYTSLASALLKKKERERKGKEGSTGCSFALERIVFATSGMRLSESMTQWMLLCFIWFDLIWYFIYFDFFFFCGDICLISWMLYGVGCRLSAILSGLHTSSSTPALCREAKRLLFSIHRNRRHRETLLGNDFMTCFLCVKSHVKYSVFWMELCFSLKIATYSNCMFWVKSNGTYTVRGHFWNMKRKKKTKPKDIKKKLQSCLPCKRNLEFIL